MLGGSSGLNLLAWNRPAKEELDSFEVFAPNSGWNWEGLLPHFKKTENILTKQVNPLPGIPHDETNDNLFEGHDGPVKVLVGNIEVSFS